MNGNAMYEVTKLRIAEQQWVAQQAREAREQRAAARAARRARKRTHENVPVIPDFAHEMFAAASDAVPAPRPGQESTDDGRARTSR
ncbi:MAG: hypothetical protein ACRDNS_25150 [Trebonia sp.]